MNFTPRNRVGHLSSYRIRTLAGGVAAVLLSCSFGAACNTEDRSSSNMAAVASSSLPVSAETVNPVFVVTEEELRKAFDSFELKGEGNQNITLGQKLLLKIQAKRIDGSLETLNLTIMFLQPLDLARQKGYSFGLVAESRTPEDRKAFENGAISTILKQSNEVTFRVWMDQPKDPNASIPLIVYQLIDKSGSGLDPITQPTSYESSNDLLGDVAIAQEGQLLTFPVFSGPNPNVTDKMSKLTLRVKIDDAISDREFTLKKQ
jgi:hypothetical protein